jgi:hypothetical protein
MSLGELAWRVRSMLRDGVDRVRYESGLVPSPAIPPAIGDCPESGAGFRVTLIRSEDRGVWTRDALHASWYERLLEQAEPILQHKLTFFDLKERHLGDPIDWNRDHDIGKAAPMRFAPSIDYRDYKVTGDAKVVWEPNRHHHLVVLARAYRASGDIRFAQGVVEQLESWISQCPFWAGMNWRSPLELAIRLINWVWAIDLIRESGLFAGGVREKLLRSAWLHLWEITRKFSKGSSANNHLIGEAAGVYIGACYFTELPGTEQWRKESRDILAREILVQTYPDGCNREHAFGYHLFVLQFFLFAGIVSKRVGEEFPLDYWSRLADMLEFAGALTEGGGGPQMFGDCDDGYVLDLGDGPVDPSGLLAVGAIHYRRADFKAWAGDFRETALWLFGEEGRERFDAISLSGLDGHIGSRAFPDSGYYLLQCGRRGGEDRISVLFDCGELGFSSIAAHGHADALSFTLRIAGVDVLVDPGTYDYFKYPLWRDYFRSTRAHNTIVVDGVDQSVMMGPFLWGERAKAKCIENNLSLQGGYVIGVHDGYKKRKGCLHSRRIEVDGKTRNIYVIDMINGKGAHDINIYFHISNKCNIIMCDENTVKIGIGNNRIIINLDSKLKVSSIIGEDNIISGWHSDNYHVIKPSSVVIGNCLVNGDMEFTSIMQVE